MNDGLSSMRLGIPFGGWNGDEPKRAVRPGQLQREHRRRNSWAKIGQNYEWLRAHEPAHSHAECQGQQAKFDFDGKMIAGDMNSKTARRLIKQWASAHRAELEGQLGENEEGARA